MRKQQSQPLGHVRGMGDEEAIWRIGEAANQEAIKSAFSWVRAVAAMTSALNGGPLGASTSEDTRGAIQPIISTGKAASRSSSAPGMLKEGYGDAYSNLLSCVCDATHHSVPCVKCDALPSPTTVTIRVGKVVPTREREYLHNSRFAGSR